MGKIQDNWLYIQYHNGIINTTKSQPFCPRNLGMSEKTLKELIAEAGYTYRDLAEKLGTGHDAIVAWGKGTRVPRLDNAIALAAELGVSLKTLSAALGQDVSRLPDDMGGDEN